MERIRSFFKKETVLCIAALAALVTMIPVPPDGRYPGYIDLRVLCLLFSLMAVVAGFQRCGAFRWLTWQLLRRIRSGRILGVTLVMLPFFSAIPKIAKRLQTLADVGLGYVRLGQSSTTLSGGEAQRVKLATELSKRSTGKTIYILDEPTTGLHTDDVKKLLSVLQRLVDAGNTVLVIEHNLDVIKCADYLIDLGPEGGSGGGSVVAVGTPEEVSKTKGSFTGEFLKPLLKK